MSQTKKLYIFDFDGTIADSVPAALRIIEDLSEEYRLPEVDPALVAELKHKSIKELLHMSGLTWIQIPGFLKKARLRFRHMVNEVVPIGGMPEMLLRMKEQNLRLGILTSNREDNVRDFLKKHQLEVFEFVDSSKSLFGKSRKLNKIMRRTGLEARDLLMVGDEVRDIEACKKTGITSVAVTWGFNSAELLRTSRPDHLIQTSSQLSQLLLSSSISGSL